MDPTNETLAAWRQQEQDVRARFAAGGGRIGTLQLTQIEGKSGLEIIGEMFAGALPFPPIGETLDFVPIEVQKGRAVFQGKPQERHYNPHGSVHGGWFATLLDSAVGCAVHSALPAEKSYTTLELKVNMIRKLTRDVPLVRAEGNVIHVGGQVATAEGRLVGPDGKLYAHATTTCLIFPRPKGHE